MEGEASYIAWSYLARTYLDLQHLRMACEARLRKLGKDAPEFVKTIMRDYHQALLSEEKDMLGKISEQLKTHVLWEWCEGVKGLGPVACLTFVGFVNPFKADTAGKAKAYMGLIPGARMQSGKRIRVNFEAKGRAWLLTRNVIMATDDYYRPFFLKKKHYYLETERKVFHDGEWILWPPFKEIIADPTRCPIFEECRERREKKAKRLGRKVKEPSCKGHCDNMAKRWLAGLLVSHATEKMREAEGLDTSNFKSHRDYIPPKPV